MSPADGGRRALRAIAPAKINLTLEIVGRRADGYHDLISAVHTVDLADSVEIAAGTSGSVRLVDRAGAPVALLEGDEIIRRTWQRLIERYGVDRRAAVTVAKRIPLAAGLGGGSSDAAAFLRLAQRWWGQRVPAAALTEVAAAIGADVPLFLAGGAVVMEGRGERVQPLPDSPGARRWAALVYTPDLPLPEAKTRTMFAALRPSDLGDRGATRRLQERLERGEPPRPEDLFNTFDAVADEVLVGLSEARRRVAAATGAAPTLAGAGPSLYVLGAEAALSRAASALDGAGARARVLRPLARADAVRIESVPAGAPS